MRLVAPLLLLPFLAVSAAADAFACSFEIDGAQREVALVPHDGGWRLEMRDGQSATFQRLSGEGFGALHLISHDFDPDAGAVAFLTLTEGGAAFLSVHGRFVTPQGQTFQGHCA